MEHVRVLEEIRASRFVNEDPVEFFTTHDKWVAMYLIALRMQMFQTVMETRNGTPWVRFDFMNRTECEQHWNDYRSGIGSVSPGSMRMAFYFVQGAIKSAKVDPKGV